MTLFNLPASSCAADVVMTLTSTTGITQSPFSKEEQAFKWDGKFWSVDFRLPILTNRQVAGEWKAFGAKMEGRYHHVLIGDPSAKVPLGAASGSPVVDGGGQTGNTLNTRNWPVSTDGVLLEGDYIQIGTGSAARLHMVTSVVDTDTAGDAQISIMPALRGSPADGTTIIYNEPKGVFRLADDAFSWSVSPTPVFRFSYSFVEVV